MVATTSKCEVFKGSFDFTTQFDIAAFEIALVRLSETSDYLLRQVNHPLGVSVGQVRINNHILFVTI